MSSSICRLEYAPRVGLVTPYEKSRSARSKSSGIFGAGCVGMNAISARGATWEVAVAGAAARPASAPKTAPKAAIRRISTLYEAWPTGTS